MKASSLLTPVIFLLLLTSALFALPEARAQPRPLKDEVAFYIDTYGEVLPAQDPEVARAHRVFERVRAVADKNSKRLPQLVVVNSRADPWAIALPDGHIVLSKQAVAICHQEASLGEAEARLAFVLGHELAHLAHDDFWHHEVHGFLAAHTSTQHLANFLHSHRPVKERELAADDKGFIYAALAGYSVDALLKTGAGRPHFFNFWMQQTNTRVQSADSTVEDRAALLRERLRDLQPRLRFFDFGVRLSHFDYCDDGVYFFREFQKVFPGREVLNNLGYCYIQLARQEMEAERAYFYWMPLLLDGETRAQALVRRGGPSLKTLKQAATGKTEGFLKEAVDYLQQAAAADPGYVPARLNLAVAYLYLGKPHQARALLSEARELAPEDISLQGLEALALYEQSEVGLDLWPTAVARLEKLVASPEAPPALRFNLARLLSVRPRPTEARGYWNRLAETAGELPAPIQALVCQEQSALPPQSCPRSSAKPVQPLPWKWPVSVSGFERLSAQARQNRLQGWQAIPFDWYKDKLHGSIYRHPEGGAEVLELDHFVQMQVLRGERLGRVGELAAYCARPLRQRPLVQGIVWSCNHWAALTLGDTVKEVWWVAK
jgi:tetratricopeptide (TPR) repeat protein